MSVVPYEVTIQRIEGAVIHLTVRLIHIDFLTFPVSKTFAFQLLGEPLLDTRENRALSQGMPITQVMDWEDFLDKAFILEHAGGFIASVVLETTHNDPLAEEALLEALTSGDPARQVTGTYQITVTHPGWALHLKPGMTFQSTAIDFGEGAVWHGVPRVPGDITWRRAVDQTEGFQPYLRDDDWLKLAHDLHGNDPHLIDAIWRHSGQLVTPARGAFYYDPDPVWTGANLSLDRLRGLLNQCVVLTAQDTLHASYAGLLLHVSDTHLELGLSRQRKRWIAIERLTSIGIAQYRIPLIHGDLGRMDSGQ